MEVDAHPSLAEEDLHRAAGLGEAHDGRRVAGRIKILPPF